MNNKVASIWPCKYFRSYLVLVPPKHEYSIPSAIVCCCHSLYYLVLYVLYTVKRGRVCKSNRLLSHRPYNYCYKESQVCCIGTASSTWRNTFSSSSEASRPVSCRPKLLFAVPVYSSILVSRINLMILILLFSCWCCCCQRNQRPTV